MKYLIAILALMALPLHAATTYSCDFQGTYCDFAEQAKPGDTLGARSSFVAPGRDDPTAVRLHTEPGDNQNHGSGDWERNDLIKGPDSTYCNEGQEEWWAFSIMFPLDYVYPPGPDGGVVMDFHHNSSSGLPNLSIDTMPARGMRIRGYGGSRLNEGQYGTQITDPYGAGLSNVARNKWYDFVFHIKWSSTSKGSNEAWLNGKKIMSYIGPTLYSGISCYLKLANYHGPFGKASSIVFDRVRRSDIMSDVALTSLEGMTPTPPPAPPSPPPQPIVCTPAPFIVDPNALAAGQVSYTTVITCKRS